VYITAFALDKGESVASLIKDPPPARQYHRYCRRKTAICFSIVRSSALPSQPMWTQKRPPSWLTLKSVGVEALSGKISEPAWKAKPSWYLIATDDKMIPPDAQRSMSKRRALRSLRSRAATPSTCRSQRLSQL